MAHIIKAVPVTSAPWRGIYDRAERKEKPLDSMAFSQVRDVKRLVRDKFKNPETVKLFKQTAMAAAMYRAAYEGK